MKCVCGTDGWKVERITVGSHVNPEYWHLLGDDFYFCPNPECDVVYFNGRVTFTVKEVKTKVFFKEKGSPRPLCYCKQVTEEDVVEAIKRGARSVKEVEEMTGIGNGGHCLVTNPSGRCCRRFYVEFINRTLETLKSEGDVRVEVEESSSEECCAPDRLK